MSAAKTTIVILASGIGTNARALLEHARRLPQVEIAAVITDRPGVPVLDVAKEFTVPAMTFPKGEGLLAELKQLAPQWAFLAGYKRILPAAVLEFFQDEGFFRVLNVHPSLLPSYPGLNGYERAFADGVDKSGVTVHLVDAGLDTGPAILQESFARDAGDTLETFMAKGQRIEHKLFTHALELVAQGKIGSKK